MISIQSQFQKQRKENLQELKMKLKLELEELIKAEDKQLTGNLDWIIGAGV